MSQRLLSLRNTRSGPVADLFDLGMSFRLMLSWGVLPPLATMNEFLQCGRDDTDAEGGLLQWEPFSLTQAEYNRLAQKLAHKGHRVRAETVASGGVAPSYERWFAAHLGRQSTQRSKSSPKKGTRRR